MERYCSIKNPYGISNTIYIFLIVSFKLIESFQLHSIADETLIAVEVLPKHYVLIDGLHRLCARYVTTRLANVKQPVDDTNFQVNARILWPSM
jgi:hypothetical protein